MLIRKPDDIPSSEITPYSVYLDRRRFLGTVAAGAAASLIPADLQAHPPQQEELTPFEDVTNYNNFYEFGTDKEDPARNSKSVV